MKTINSEISTSQGTKPLRILWHSVAPFIASGYGVVTKHMVSRLLEHGYFTVVSALYGLQQGGVISWKGILILPTIKGTLDPLGFDSAAQHYQKFSCNLGVFTSDFWVSKKFTRVIPNTLCYSPLDHEDYPEECIDILNSYTWVAVPSRHAQKELEKKNVKAHFLPHGVDTNVFSPKDKIECRRNFSIREDAFVIGIVAGNYDDEPRKGWDANFLAIKYFLEAHPDAKKNTVVVVHTDPTHEKGHNLYKLSKHLGIEDYIYWNDPYIVSIVGFPEVELAKLYNTFDVFLLLSRREGFCLPALEAQACGVPCILNDFSALSERNDYGRVGWLVPPAAFVYSPLQAKSSIPDPQAAVKALEEAYYDEKKRKTYAKKSLEFARQQNWDRVFREYALPLFEEIGQEIAGGLRKIGGSPSSNDMSNG